MSAQGAGAVVELSDRDASVGVGEELGVAGRETGGLEEDGYVHREAHPVVPPHVEYSLTADVKQLAELVLALMCFVADRTSSYGSSLTLGAQGEEVLLAVVRHIFLSGVQQASGRSLATCVSRVVGRSGSGVPPAVVSDDPLTAPVLSYRSGAVSCQGAGEAPVRAHRAELVRGRAGRLEHGEDAYVDSFAVVPPPRPISSGQHRALGSNRGRLSEW